MRYALAMFISISVFFLCFGLRTEAGEDQAEVTKEVRESKAPENTSAMKSRAKAIIVVEKHILTNMLTFVSSKNWETAKFHFYLYKALGSNQDAKTEIDALLKSKNRDGAVAVIRLTATHLINPKTSPIISTRQVKMAFIQVIRNTKKWEIKAAVLKTLLDTFSEENMTGSERVAFEKLYRALKNKSRDTATVVEDILEAIVEERVNETPLDD